MGGQEDGNPCLEAGYPLENTVQERPTEAGAGSGGEVWEPWL